MTEGAHLGLSGEELQSFVAKTRLKKNRKKENLWKQLHGFVGVKNNRGVDAQLAVRCVCLCAES